MPAEMNTQHIEVPPNDALSELDKAYVCINYPGYESSALSGCLTGCVLTIISTGVQNDTNHWTLRQALQVAGVPSDTTSKILEHEYDPTGEIVRGLFSQWNAAMHKSHSD